MSSSHSGHAMDEKQVKVMVLLSLALFFIMSFAGHRIFVAHDGPENASASAEHGAGHPGSENKESH